MQAIPREMPYSHKQFIVNTTRETLMSQSLHSPNGEGKVEESHIAHDVADKDEICGKNQSQQAVHKPRKTSMPSKSREWSEWDQGES